MPVSCFLRRLGGWLLALAFVVSGCVSDTTTSDDAGGVAIQLQLADGTEIDEVSYVVSGNDMVDMMGAINTSAPGSTASVEIFGIPEGDDYLIMMAATSTDGETACSGSAFFDVSVGQVTNVMVILRCKLPQRFGGVRVNGKLNVCAALAKMVVAPLQTSVGNQLEVFAQASDKEGDAIAYSWSATNGSFDDPNAAVTMYTCEQPGDHTVSVLVSDDGFEYCEDSWDIDVTCVGDGGTGGAGGMGGGAAGGGGTAGTAGGGGQAGGSAGSGGAAGMAGGGGQAGGSAGSGGTAGGGGQGGGAAGSGGTAGSGGMAGTGGIAGTGGTAGTAGSGGMTGGGGQGGGGGFANICPSLFVINTIPSTIQPGNTTTMVETRGRDDDGLPMPLVLTLRALWGSFENTENLQLPTNVVGQNATYICDRPGPVELCVDATDGACTKTLCTSVTCPDDIPEP